jgi:sigma54-dependent transcription regulator
MDRQLGLHHDDGEGSQQNWVIQDRERLDGLEDRMHHQFDTMLMDIRQVEHNVERRLHDIQVQNAHQFEALRTAIYDLGHRPRHGSSASGSSRASSASNAI